MEVEHWLAARDGIAHRRELAAAGFPPRELRTARLQRIGQSWLATESAPRELLTAARLRGRLACVSAAMHLGLAQLHRPAELHIWVPGNSDAPRQEGVRLHRSRSIDPARRHALVERPVDVLSHVAECLPELEALVVWESALRRGVVGRPLLSRIVWPGPRQRRLAALADDRSDSLLETIAAYRLRDEGIPFRQQAELLGRPVDFLIGERLVLQIDGYAFHAGARQRRSDIEFDTKLHHLGMPVMRKDYDAVVHRWRSVAEDIRLSLLLAPPPKGISAVRGIPRP